MTAMSPEDPNWLPLTLGTLIAKVDNLGQQIGQESIRTGSRFDSVKDDISTLSGRVDSIEHALSSRINAIESDMDRFRGASTAIKAAWIMAGGIVTGLAITLIQAIVR